MSVAGRVSIVVPVFNHARYVEACLGSLCAQAWADLELIVLDDGSTDDSWERVRSFPVPAGVRLVRETAPNRGAAAVLNDGLGRATGQWVAICNSDDLFAPDRVRALAAELQSSGARFAFSAISCIDEAGKDVTSRWPYARSLAAIQARIATYPTVGFSLLVSNGAISTGNFFFERSLFDEVGGFRPLKLTHDWDFLLRCLLVTEPRYVARPLYRYRLHAANSFLGLLGPVAKDEDDALLRSFLQAACSAPPANPTCPSPAHWPEFFSAFLEAHHLERGLERWSAAPETAPAR